MIEKLSKYSILYFIILFFLFALIGYFFLSENYPRSDSLKPFHIQLNVDDLLKIMTNNLLIGVLILFGFLTLNLTNLSFIVFNGLLYGIAIHKYSLEFGLSKTLTAILPHGIFEYLGLAVLFSCSIDINISLYQYFNKQSTSPIQQNVMNNILIGFSLIIFSSLIEVYFTPLIL
ncbi:MAG: stage II sporulation protein M [Saprospiraceae bacterium]|nr:stage II sporulation protein M [Saprospiraceae bacterium]